MIVSLPVRALLLASALSLHSAQGAEAVAPQALSGDYSLHFEQTAKDCGPRIDPIDINVSLRATDGKLQMRFPSGFLGIKVLEADYDGSGSEINQQFEQRVDLGATAATLKLTLQATVQTRAGQPEFNYTVVFDKIADDPDWNCRVEGAGWAKKT